MKIKGEFIKLYEQNPEMKKIERIVSVLRNGGLIIYPTDTVYSLGCDIYSKSAIERISRIKGIHPTQSRFSFICYDLSNISEYTKPFSNTVFKVMKKAFPGPFTFILPASSKVPKELNSKRKTVGIRVPDNNIVRTIVKELGNPVFSTSIYDEDEILEYSTDPELIFEKYCNNVDIVIDGGFGNNIPSTVVDATSEDLEIIREGLGDFNEIA